MIRDFWAENYLSIRERQGLSFIAKTKDDFLSYEISPGVFLNKLGILYGANASGKSNILYAIQNVFELLVISRTDINQAVITRPSFELTKTEPTRLHVSFYADGVRYDYDIAYLLSHILEESLYYYPNNSKALFYERTFKGEGIQAEIKFGASLNLTAATKKTLAENTLNNHSVLSAYRKISLKEDILPIASLLNWAVRHVHNINEHQRDSLGEEIKEACGDEKLKRFYLQMLKKADLNINGFRVVTRLKEVPENIRKAITENEMFTEEAKKRMLEPKDSNEIFFVNQSKEGDFEIPIGLQSSGTLHYLEMLHFLYHLITGSHIYLLDELDEKLHDDLLLYFLNVFIYHSESSQLVFTTQELSLLAEDLLNEHRDLVWFVEKKQDTASSEYNRGDSFGLHKNSSLYNSYKIGKLGAKPELGSFFIDLD